MKKLTKAEVEVMVKAGVANNPFFKIGHMAQGWYHIGNGIVTDYEGYRKWSEELEQDEQDLIKKKDV